MRRLLPFAGFVVLLAGCGGGSRSALPYEKVTYNADDARRAFAAERVSLVFKSHVPGGGTTLGDKRDVFEVDVFGDPAALRKSGFQDLQHAADCKVEGHLALHWHGNVRAVLNCNFVRDDGRWVARMDRALATLR